MLDITVTACIAGKRCWLDILAVRDLLGQPCWIVFDPRERDPYTGKALQRTFHSFEEAIDEYDQILLQAAVAHLKRLREMYQE